MSYYGTMCWKAGAPSSEQSAAFAPDEDAGENAGLGTHIAADQSQIAAFTWGYGLVNQADLTLLGWSRSATVPQPEPTFEQSNADYTAPTSNLGDLGGSFYYSSDFLEFMDAIGVISVICYTSPMLSQRFYKADGTPIGTGVVKNINAIGNGGDQLFWDAALLAFAAMGSVAGIAGDANYAMKAVGAIGNVGLAPAPPPRPQYAPVAAPAPVFDIGTTVDPDTGETVPAVSVNLSPALSASPDGGSLQYSTADSPSSNIWMIGVVVLVLWLLTEDKAI